MQPDILDTLGKMTLDKSTVPETLRQVGKGVWYGKRGRVHHLVIPVTVPVLNQGYCRLRVLGDGEVLDEREVECHSWLRNYYNWASSLCGKDADDAGWGDGAINGKDTTNNTRSAARPFTQNYGTSMEVAADKVVPTRGYVADEGVDSYGIVVGTDDTAVDTDDDYALGGQIAHGTAAGELYCAFSKYPAVYSFDSGALTHSLYRYFDNFNADSNTITIDEIGLISYMEISAGYYFLVARDVLDESVDVPFRALLEVMYDFSLDYPGSGSPLRNFYNYVFSQFACLNGSDATFDDGYVNFTDTTNNLRLPIERVIGFRNTGSVDDSVQAGFRGRLNYVDMGILAGSGNTGVTFDDYYLDTLIPNATMQYQHGSVPTRSWADPVMTISHLRNAINVSGGNVTVRELGLIGNFSVFPLATYHCMVCRDVFSDVVIPNGDTLAMTYQLSVTYPS